MYAHRPRPAPRLGLSGMTSDLRNRLLLLLVLPLCVLALVGVWMDYRSADDAASRHDQRLLRLPRRWPTRWWRLHP